MFPESPVCTLYDDTKRNGFWVTGGEPGEIEVLKVWKWPIVHRSKFWPIYILFQNKWQKIFYQATNAHSLRPVGRRRHYVFGLSVHPSVRTRISLTRNLKNPWVDFYHTWPRGAPWRVDELIRFWARSAQRQRSEVNELGLNMLFLPR